MADPTAPSPSSSLYNHHHPSPPPFSSMFSFNEHLPRDPLSHLRRRTILSRKHIALDHLVGQALAAVVYQCYSRCSPARYGPVPSSRLTPTHPTRTRPTHKPSSEAAYPGNVAQNEFLRQSKKPGRQAALYFSSPAKNDRRSSCQPVMARSDETAGIFAENELLLVFRLGFVLLFNASRPTVVDDSGLPTLFFEFWVEQLEGLLPGLPWNRPLTMQELAAALDRMCQVVKGKDAPETFKVDQLQAKRAAMAFLLEDMHSVQPAHSRMEEWYAAVLHQWLGPNLKAIGYSVINAHADLGGTYREMMRSVTEDWKAKTAGCRASDELAEHPFHVIIRETKLQESAVDTQEKHLWKNAGNVVRGL
ncbi:hypothetical protein BDZ89DRAFT_1152026 [Hymenopellis radicata]|nr:hypothetical protein BDZ89DRAFT_1152026 [Hymenopellis radicata]